ncbi:SusC/RagA family TonB-linked outer membrane protein [Compostibacter hankyongensis]|uniref:SusC/RagA family TonB-linked outer membrane protein n=2 Tax=Compostibacter hankyongensis TaxID=1007089 RepID=A0ABP8FJW1_9BACT
MRQLLCAAALSALMQPAAAQVAHRDTVSYNTDTLPAAGAYRLPNYAPVYPALYRQDAESKTVEAIGFLKGESLGSAPATFISTGLTGRIAGLYLQQSSGEPGNDGASGTLRGRSPLVLVDGIPRTLPPWSINPEEIASVTVLKDALSTAMLGMRSMNGAILITTRKGEQQRGLHLDFTAQTGISTPVKFPEPLSAYSYANLYNEALVNDGRPPVYTQADLDAYKNHTDPLGHPDINWYDKILKEQTPFSRYTLNAEGANKAMRYFVSLDYLNQKGLFRESDINTYSTNSGYQRYIFRSNVDVNLSRRLSMSLNVFGRIRDQNAPGAGTQSIFDALLATPANAYPIQNPDGSLGGNINYSNNLYGQSIMSGYTQDVFSDGYADLVLKRNMDDVLKGWWVKGTLSYVLTLYQNIDRSKAFETFQMHIDPATGDTTYQRFGTKAEQNNTSTVTRREHQIYAEAATGYTHSRNGNTLDAMLLYSLDHNTINTTASQLPESFETLAGNVQYSIRDKYIVQVSASYGGNNYYPKGNRFGFFPAAGIGWNIDKENFFNKDGFINTLKLRATYGLTGNAVAGYYDYIDHYVGAGGYYFGASAASQSGITENQPRDITTWEKGEKLDVGMDMRFAENRGAFSVDYYRNRLTDLVISRGKSSAALGYGNSIVRNLGKDLYSGLELSAGWSDKINDFQYYISGNFSLSDSKVLFNDEPAYPYSWMERTGRAVNGIYGYVADGFVTQAEEGPVVEGYRGVPGDLRYRDLNGDGIINQYDQQAIGNEKPLLFYGADLGFSWKHFSLSLLIQGAAHRDIVLTGPGEWAFQNDGKGQAWQHNLDRWTPATASTAAYPRVSVGTNVNNDIVSSFWVRTGSYVRLKNAELAYSFDDIRLGKIKVSRLRIFLNGLNLLTISPFKQSDPETLPGSYPLQRIVNGGITVKF